MADSESTGGLGVQKRVWGLLFNLRDILCGISKGTFEIPLNVSYPYIESCVFYSHVKI